MVKKSRKVFIIIVFFTFSFCNGVSGIKHWGEQVVDYLHVLSSDLSKTYVSVGNVEWPEDNRVLIYYEDLIRNPKETLEKILLFLREDLDCLDLFIKNYDKHSKNTIQFYINTIGPSVTKDNTINYHANKLKKKKTI